MKVWGFGHWLFFRHFIDEEESNEPAKHWFASLFLQTFPGVFWADTELRPVFRSKLLLGFHLGAPCQRGRVGWDANTWLSTGILTKHTACFSSNYIYPTNAWFVLHANEISLIQHSVLMNNNNVAARIISARISFCHSEFSQKPFPHRFNKSNWQKSLGLHLTPINLSLSWPWRWLGFIPIIQLKKCLPWHQLSLIALTCKGEIFKWVY